MIDVLGQLGVCLTHGLGNHGIDRDGHQPQPSGRGPQGGEEPRGGRAGAG